MHRFLATQDSDGYFDFFSNIIVLNRYTASHAKEIKEAIAWVPNIDSTPRGVSIRALLKHEITHYLDMTTTAWGWQYIYRKLRMIKSLDGPKLEAAQSQEVFMLETAEVDIHQELLKVDTTVSPNSCDSLRHGLQYTEQFGTCIIIFYYQHENPRHHVPLSMLSMLEANATASEFLSEISDAESIEDNVVRLITEKDIACRFSALLDDSQRLEYSVLLRLTKIHFEQITLRELLILVAALCRFSLDATDMGMAAMANKIEESSLNRKLGHSIAMELRRASQRQLLYFKTVLLMNGWMSEMDAHERNDYLLMIKSEPSKAIRSLWLDRLGIDEVTLDFGRDFMLTEKQRLMNEVGVLRDAEIFEKSFAANAARLNGVSAGLLKFGDLKLINVMLEDDTEIEMPNRIDIEVLEYFNQNVEIFTAVGATYRNQTPRKFHIPLDSIDLHIS